MPLIDYPSFYKDYNSLAALITGLGTGGLDNRYFKGYTSPQKNLLDYPVGIFGLSDTNQEDSPDKHSNFAILIRAKESNEIYMTVLMFCQTSNVTHRIWVKGGSAAWEGFD